MRTLQTDKGVVMGRKLKVLRHIKLVTANGERPAKATQRRAKPSAMKEGVETGRRASSVNRHKRDTKMKAQSRPRIARASKDEVVKHNRLVPRSNRGCPIPKFLGLLLPKPYDQYILVSFYEYANKRGVRRMVGLRHMNGGVLATSYARFVYQIVYGKLPKHLHVDHIDDDHLNDALHNLQAITQKSNNVKAVESAGTMRQLLDIKCCICKSVFSVYRNLTYLGGHKSILKGCSRSCGGKIAHLKLTREQKIKLFKKCVVREYRNTTAVGKTSNAVRIKP